MSNQPVKASNYIECICGLECKGKAAHANHARQCDQWIAYGNAIKIMGRVPSYASFQAAWARMTPEQRTNATGT